MDKTWMKASLTSESYKFGAQCFISFAKAKAVRGEIVCPCVKCCNRVWLNVDLVHRHILSRGFLPGYTTWTFHGEERVDSRYQSSYTIAHPTGASGSRMGEEDIRGLIHDALGYNLFNSDDQHGVVEMRDTHENIGDSGTKDFDSGIPSHLPPQPNLDTSHEDARFKKLLEDCDKELYPGCKYSNLAFNLHLYHLKCLGGVSNKVFTMLLEFLRDVFPNLTSLPSTTYEAKKLTNELGLGYKKIHACPNDCMLYWGEREKQESCHVCSASRWKAENEGVNDTELEETSVLRKPKPAKVLRYFPLIPRLKRLYMSSKTAKDMRWHDEVRTKDGKLRHPADGQAWKAFDDKYSGFASDPRNVRLGLASDGFNPFRTMSTTYSTWPVLLIPYNLPPWICMKPQSLILSMIIPGEKGPGNDIDVYLQPLILELKQLWDGVSAYDAFAKENFLLHASICWTINDFPAYANLSGWSTKGRVACPICANSTHSIWLKHGKKHSYMGHRRWLRHNHPYRFQSNQFDGTVEHRAPPAPLSGSAVLKELEGMTFTYGKTARPSRKRNKYNACTSVHDFIGEEVAESLSSNIGAFDDADNLLEEDIDGDQQLWKKRSIFFDLPYWEFNLLRHNLDVMHIEKNVCDNVLGTLLNLDGKTKDNEKARRDLMEMGIRHDLHPIERPNKKPYLPPACYSMSNAEKSAFLQVLKELKVPDGYASNISRGVSMKDRKLFNLKSHDGHVLMQDIFPIALKASLHSRSQSWVIKVISDLCHFFKVLCGKVLDLSELDKLEEEVAMTLCELEKMFLPSFFTIMVHLIIHLIHEVRLGGPVHYRWMYPIERYLVRLKSYVRNRARPEGSMAEGYVAEECMTFCSRYFEGVQTPFNRRQRNDENIPGKEKYLLNSSGRALGKVECVELDDKSLAQAHRYVLLNHEKIQPYRDSFLAQEQNFSQGRIDARTEERLLIEKFPHWLRCQVPFMKRSNCDKNLIALAEGVSRYAKKYSGYIINGYRFLTKRRERYRRTQNSGVMVEAEGGHYYGAITEIVELDYFSTCKVVLFRCDWVDIRPSKGLKNDKFGFPMVNFSRLMHTGQALKDDPFIVASQARQVFYVGDQREAGWSHVVITKPRDLFDMGPNMDNGVDECYPECIPFIIPGVDLSDMSSWRRLDIQEEED